MRRSLILAWLLLPITVQLGGTAAVAGTVCSWSLLPPAPLSGIFEQSSGIAATSQDDAWAVADNLTDPVVARFHGGSWHTTHIPDPGAGTGSLRAITAISADDVWAVGYHYAPDNSHYDPLAVHWDGSSWSVVPPPTTTNRNRFLQSVSASGPNNVWAVGYGSSPSVGIAEHWNGSEWRRVQIPADGDILNGVGAFSNHDVWAVGYNASYHWTGSDWDLYPTPTSTYLTGVSGSSSTDVWAAGWGSGGYAAHWDGASWTEVPVPQRGLVPNSLLAIVSRSPNSAWAVGSSGPSRHKHPLVEHWNGAEWHVRRTPADGMDNAPFTAISAVPHSRTVWALGNNGLVERFC